MQIAPKLSEVSKFKRNVAACFVVGDLQGRLKAYAIVDASRYDMGTSRPAEVRSWSVEFLSIDEFDLGLSTSLKGAIQVGEVVHLKQDYFLVVGVDGSEIVEAYLTECATLLQQKVPQKQNEEKIVQKVEDELREEQKLIEERCNLYEEGRKQRRERLIQDAHDLAALLKAKYGEAVFPELKAYEEAIKQERQIQLPALGQKAIELAHHEFELQKANDREHTSLKPMRQKLVQWKQHQQELARSKQLAEEKRLAEEREET
ncbi:MAG: hypothetical protein ACRYFS_20915 [Janthinobacterium lividum]